MSSVNMTLQSNTSCELVLNKFNLPIEAFTKSYLKDLKPALKFRRERIRTKKELDKCVALIFKSDEKRKAKAAKLAAKRAAILKKIDDTGYGIVFDRTLSIEYFKKILKDIPELKRADKEYDRRVAREAKAALKKAKKEAKRKEKERKRIESLKKTNDWIQATKHGKTVVKRDMLKMMKTMESDGYTINDLIAELERQLQ
tara:strand:+ start:1453 stop:2052 length:600 start_codon:yes stop_codon:yes gene_type:complete